MCAAVFSQYFPLNCANVHFFYIREGELLMESWTSTSRTLCAPQLLRTVAICLQAVPILPAFLLHCSWLKCPLEVLDMMFVCPALRLIKGRHWGTHMDSPPTWIFILSVRGKHRFSYKCAAELVSLSLWMCFWVPRPVHHKGEMQNPKKSPVLR